MTMELSVERDGGMSWAAVTGRVDGANAQDLHERALAAVEGADPYLAIDMADLSFISSAGLRVILMLAKRLAANGGKLVLCGLSGLIGETFSISGFDKIIPIVEDRKAARGALK